MPSMNRYSKFQKLAFFWFIETGVKLIAKHFLKKSKWIALINWELHSCFQQKNVVDRKTFLDNNTVTGISTPLAERSNATGASTSIINAFNDIFIVVDLHLRILRGICVVLGNVI